MMKGSWISIAFLNVFAVFAQNTSEDFQVAFTRHLKENNVQALQQTVREWRTTLPNDAEGFVAAFNYYLLNASGNHILEEQSSDENAIRLHNIEGKYVDSALTVLAEGLELHPMRLDMHMGYIYTLGQNHRWEEFTPRILSLLDRAKLTNYKGWMWSGNRPIGDEAKVFIIESIADYQLMLYATYSDERLLDLRKIAINILQVQEGHIDQLNFMALSYSEMGDYVQAYKWIRKAMEMSSDIPEVVANYERILKGAYSKKEAKKELNRFRKNADKPLYEVLTRLYYSL